MEEGNSFVYPGFGSALGIGRRLERLEATRLELILINRTRCASASTGEINWLQAGQGVVMAIASYASSTLSIPSMRADAMRFDSFFSLFSFSLSLCLSLSCSRCSTTFCTCLRTQKETLIR